MNLGTNELKSAARAVDSLFALFALYGEVASCMLRESWSLPGAVRACFFECGRLAIHYNLTQPQSYCLASFTSIFSLEFGDGEDVLDCFILSFPLFAQLIPSSLATTYSSLNCWLLYLAPDDSCAIPLER